MTMSHRRILVTGSSGFIGTHLVRHFLAKGQEVVGLDLRPPEANLAYRHEPCDLLNHARLFALLAELQPDAVVHLAARTDLAGETVEDYPANFEGVLNLVQAIRRTPSVQRAIFISSQLVCKAGYLPSHPEDYCPPNPYGESKVRTEQVVRRENGGGVTWCLLRPTTIWGSGMNAHYASFFNHLKHGRYFHSGAPSLYKSYGYVGNSVHQICRFLEAPASAVHQHVFYLADYQPLCLQAWINSIAKGLGRNPPLTLPMGICRSLAALGDVFQAIGLGRVFPYNSFRLNNILAEYRYDMTPTEAICGPLPYSFDQGIEDLVAWIEKADSTGVGATQD